MACAQALQDGTLQMQVRQLAARLLRHALPAGAACNREALETAVLQALAVPELTSAAALSAAALAPPQLLQTLLAMGQRGLAVEALKATALLAEEGWAQATQMAEPALAAVGGPAAVSLAALEALRALLPTGARASWVAALRAVEQPELHSEAWRLLEACAEHCYDSVTEPELQQLLSATAGDPAHGLDVWEALAASEALAQRPGGLLGLVAPQLLPLLLDALRPEESAEASCQCLMAVAKVLGDEVLPPVVAFVAAEPRRPGLLAFGAVQDGPTAQTLQPLIRMALPTLLEARPREPQRSIDAISYKSYIYIYICI